MAIRRVSLTLGVVFALVSCGGHGDAVTTEQAQGILLANLASLPEDVELPDAFWIEVNSHSKDFDWNILHWDAGKTNFANEVATISVNKSEEKIFKMRYGAPVICDKSLNDNPHSPYSL